MFNSLLLLGMIKGALKRNGLMNHIGSHRVCITQAVHVSTSMGTDQVLWIVNPSVDGYFS
jgi:hypothetical protein